MTGGNARHSTITNNIHIALRPRLRGTPSTHSGPDLAVRSVGENVRSPDALITAPISETQTSSRLTSL